MMRVIFGLLMAAFLMVPSSAVASLPPDRTVTFVLHEVPDDPESPVKLTIALELSAEEDSYGNEIAWSVLAAEFVRPANGSNPELVWNATNPLIDTTDGLWWVEHVDPMEPKASEFVLPPAISGLALARYETDEDIDFDLMGEFYDEVERGNPYPNTGALTYSLVTHVAHEPIEEGDDEPVEMPDAPPG